MSEITFPGVEGCFEDPPEGFETFDLDCLELEELRPEDMYPGGRTAIVKPYPCGTSIAAGQWGSFQILNGLGGQIYRGLYLGTNPFYNDSSGLPHKINIEVDETDIINGPDCEDNKGGDLGLAIRDRGRWYVIKLAQPVDIDIPEIAVPINAVCLGGNNNPYSGDEWDAYLFEEWRPFIFPRRPNLFGSTVFPNYEDSWANQDYLPDAFDPDDGPKLVGITSLPWGCGWARLLPEERFKRFSWDSDTIANLEREPPPDASSSSSEDGSTSSPPTAIGAAVIEEYESETYTLSVVMVFYDQPVEVSDTVSTSDAVAYSETFDANIDVDSIEDTDRPFSNAILVYLDREILPDENVEITLAGSAVKASPHASGDPVLARTAREYVMVKLPKNACMPVINLNNSVMTYQSPCTIDTTSPITVTLDDDDESEPRTFYSVTPIPHTKTESLQVIGGNRIDPGGSSNRDAILAINGNPAVDSWQDFYPAGGFPEAVIDYTNLSAVLTPDGAGWMVSEVGGSLLGEDTTDTNNRPGLALAFNVGTGMFLSDRDVAHLTEPRMVADDQDPPEYRLVWNVFA